MLRGRPEESVLSHLAPSKDSSAAPLGPENKGLCAWSQPWTFFRGARDSIAKGTDAHGSTGLSSRCVATGTSVWTSSNWEKPSHFRCLSPYDVRSDPRLCFQERGARPHTEEALGHSLSNP